MFKFFSPAKLNLFLQVVGKRPDGYHELASVFQAISLTDILFIERSDQDRFEIRGEEQAFIPRDRSNLVLRALELFRRRVGSSFPVHIILEKNIPIQAGLGGGSSNAATLLFALNEMQGFPVALSDLMEWSKELGSDVTFFLSCGTAYCTGRGEIIEPLPQIPFFEKLLVIKPLFGLSTPLVFKALDLNNLNFGFFADQSMKKPKVQVNPLPKKDARFACKELLEGRHCYFNDLESAAYSLEPSLYTLKKNLLQCGFSHVVMSGSGTSFFALGHGQLSKDLQVKVYPVQFIRREEKKWYEL